MVAAVTDIPHLTPCSQEQQGIAGRRVLFTTPPSYADRLRNELEKVDRARRRLLCDPVLQQASAVHVWCPTIETVRMAEPAFSHPDAVGQVPLPDELGSSPLDAALRTLGSFDAVPCMVVYRCA